MKFLFFVISAFLLLGHAAAKDAQPEGEWSASLDGEWRFTIDPVVAGEAGGAWDRIVVPGNWDVLPAYSKHRGKGWYQRDFTVSKDWNGKRVRLRFEAVYHDAEVTLNGRVLGKHVGGYTPFEFDVTDLLDRTGSNVVTVCADNNYRRGAWWPWGGISRSVNLIANNEVRIVRQHIRSEPDLASGTAKIFVQYKLANAGAEPVEAVVSSAIVPSSRVKLKTKVTLAPGAEQLVEQEASLSASDVRLWHFDQPNLYTLETSVTVAGKVAHEKNDRFGIRKVEVTPAGLFLNGEKVRVPGFNRVSDSNRFGSTEPDELVRKDVDLMKEAGAVFSRLMHTPQAPNLLDYLDEKGMMIFAEIPVWGWDDPQVKKDNPLTKQWLREMIERDYNHPCIVGWSPGNEINGHYAYVESMHDYIRKELDSSRLLAYISNTANHGNMGPHNDPVTVSDIAMINMYGNPGAFSGLSGILRKRWPDKPVFVSEFGDHQIGASLKAKVPKLAGIWANITRDPYVIGGSIWTFNDYRSGYKGTPASGNREWGVVDMERRPKAAYWELRKLYSPVRSLIVDGGAVTIDPRRPDEVPSYTLRGYRVAWTAKNAAGEAVAKGEIPVPELKPGSPAWSAKIPKAKSGWVITAKLVTPTGYNVHDSEVLATQVPAAPKQ